MSEERIYTGYTDYTSETPAEPAASEPVQTVSGERVYGQTQQERYMKGTMSQTQTDNDYQYYHRSAPDNVQRTYGSTYGGAYGSYGSANSSYGSANSSYGSAGSSYGSTGSYGGGTGYTGGTTGTVRRSSGKKKGGFGLQVVKALCLALIFGLVAGGTMVGVAKLGGLNLSGKSAEAPAVQTGQAADTVQTVSQTSSEQGFTLNVVTVSDVDVPTFSATDVSDIVEAAKPSIVSVNTIVQKTTQDFFGRTYMQEGEGAGSGVIFSEQGNTLYIVTNYHVIEDSREISVAFNDGASAEASVMGYDQAGDLAVITVDMSTLTQETKDAIKIAVLGDSDALKEGNGAIAIGNALGYGISTTTGTISAVNREVQLTDGTKTLIQTDAAINPGNSGGALLNTRGEVIGINTVKFADTEVEGMGYAIPINTVIETVGDIISGRTVVKTDENTPMLGIRGGTITESLAAAYNTPQGIYVSAVIPGTAASRAGLESGYIIVGFNGQTVTTMEELQALIKECTPGQQVTIDVVIPNKDGSYSGNAETLTTIMGSASDAN